MDFTFAHFTPESIEADTTALITRQTTDLDGLITQESTATTFETTFQQFHLKTTQAAEWTCKVTLGSMVHVEKSMRDAFGEAKDRMRVCWQQTYSRLDVYRFLKRPLLISDDLSWQQKRYAHSVLQVFEGNGVHLDAETRHQLDGLKREISELESRFQRSLAEDETLIEYRREELQGCPETFLASLQTLERDGGVWYKVPVKAPQLPVILDTCCVADTRYRHMKASQARCAKMNMPILARLLAVRAQAAILLGYESWAAYKLAPTMAKTLDNVHAFLSKVETKLKPMLQKHLAALQELKDKDSDILGAKPQDSPSSTCLNLWDISYYEKQWTQQQFGLDERKIKEYFPLNWVIDHILETYEQLFDLRFEQLDTQKHAWHPDIRCYAVYNRGTLTSTAPDDYKPKPGLLGHFYLDLFSRPGKYAHQCVIPLAPCYSDASGNFHCAVAANIGNLTAPTASVASLLSHSEVRTFFHEFGHVVHCVCTQSPFVNQSWSWGAMSYPAGVEVDFLEVPSQALENWIWEPVVLRRLSGHYKNKTEAGLPEPLPEELMLKLKASRMACQAYKYARQLFMTEYDLRVHSMQTPPSESELLQLWNDMQLEMTSMRTVEETFPMASWYHIAMGYDAGFFSYIWSEVISHDFFGSKFAQDVMNATAGVEYRDHVLAAGALKPAHDIVCSFLGRESNDKAFFEALGL